MGCAEPSLVRATPLHRLSRRTVILASPRGFCAGVRRAIEAVEQALQRFGRPVYVRGPIVHNNAVVRLLEGKGAVFIRELSEAPEGAVVIFSAHGVPEAVKAEADRRGLRAFDAVCPLVAKVHREVTRHHRERRHVILVGHPEHPEIVGTTGQLPGGETSVVGSVAEVEQLPLRDDARVAYATQTTFSVDDAAAIVGALKRRFPHIVEPASSDICYATTNRQAAVKRLAACADAIIVAGETFSSNANRLAEVGRSAGCPSVQLVPDASKIDWAALTESRSIGVTAAASTPDSSVAAIVKSLGQRFDIDVTEMPAIAERAQFRPVRLDGSHAATGS